MLFYLLFFLLNVLRASGLEQTFKATWSHTESILFLVCLFCFLLVFFFPFWERWCSSQYYHVVDDCTLMYFCLLHLNVKFLFFLPFGVVILIILCTCESYFPFFCLGFFFFFLLTRTQLNLGSNCITSGSIRTLVRPSAKRRLHFDKTDGAAVKSDVGTWMWIFSFVFQGATNTFAVGEVAH